MIALKSEYNNDNEVCNSIRQSLDVQWWKLPKVPLSVGFGALFIGVGGPDLTQTSGDFFWHVSGPTRPTPPSFVSI